MKLRLSSFLPQETRRFTLSPQKVYMVCFVYSAFRVLYGQILPLFMVCSLNNAFAQAPFAQTNQLPLSFNPSFAGSKMKQRVVVAGNIGAGTSLSTKSYHNVYASYDQVWRKLGAGVGGYYGYQHFRSERNDMFQERIKTQSHVVGLCIAPKYNRMGKLNPNKIVSSFSPSFFLEYQNGREEASQPIQGQNTDVYQSKLYSTDYPNGTVVKDSTVRHSSEHHLKNHHLKMGIGLMYNSQKLLLFSKTTYGIDWGKETVNKLHTWDSGYAQSEPSTLPTKTLYFLDQQLGLGYSFGRSEGKFSFTPLAALGIRYYLNLGQKQSNGDNRPVYSYFLTSKSPSSFSSVHLSGNFRWGKFLFGGAYTLASDYHSYGGAYLGFQNQWLRASLAFFPNYVEPVLAVLF
jgi:hypothetical protein